MFARMLEFNFKLENKHELIKKVREEVLPMLKRQPGFFELLWLEGENEPTKFFAITLWHNKAEAERYQREYYPKVKYILEPFLTTPPTVKFYNVDTSFSEAIIDAVAV